MYALALKRIVEQNGSSHWEKLTMAWKLYQKGTKPPIMRYFCWKLEEKTAGVLGGLYLTGSQDGGNPTWPDLFSIKFGTKNAHKTTNSCTHRQYPLQSLHIYAKLVNNSAIIACIILFFFEINGVPTPILGKPSEASTCCYVTSH